MCWKVKTVEGLLLFGIAVVNFWVSKMEGQEQYSEDVESTIGKLWSGYRSIL